ncbi:hypothetical protein GCM10009854_50320 [Saccharopolyspora halophila]|uniref:DoxX family protein n=1 Tax=Saccharopolyspora halophila TaxID=405551 RepID=A0ABN3GZ72_9PSEU
MSQHADLRTESAPPQVTGRIANVVLWVVQVLLAAAFLFAAGAKFAGDPAVVATFDAIGAGAWLLYLVAVLEALGAIALLIPRLAGLAGAAFVALMIGALVTHLVVLGEGTLGVLPILVLSALVAWGRRRSIGELARSLR